MKGHISIIQAAERAGVSRTAIYYHAKAGRLGARADENGRLVVSEKAVSTYAKTEKRGRKPGGK